MSLLAWKRLNAILSPRTTAVSAAFSGLRQMSSQTHYIVNGYPECRFFQKAAKCANAWAAKNPDAITVTVAAYPYDDFHAKRQQILADLGFDNSKHTTCPIVVTAESAAADAKPTGFVGGCDSTLALFTEKFGTIPEAQGPAWKV